MRILAIATAVIAIASGLFVLLGYFVPVGSNLLIFRIVLVRWAVILAAVAILVGVINLLGVHWRKILTRQKGGVYSILLIVAMFATAIFGIATGVDNPIQETIQEYFREITLEAIIIPAEAALMALLAVTLVYASARLLRHRADVMSFVFLGVFIVVLLASAPLPIFGKFPLLSDIVLPWLTQIFAAAGARGILIGVALGALTTGLRVLFGIDRPYGGN